MHRRWRLIACVTLALSLAACESTDSRPLEYLETLPERDLAYPGATATCSISEPERHGIDSHAPAAVGHCYAVKATTDEITGWYDAVLTQGGWLDDVDHQFGPGWQRGYTEIRLRDFRADPTDSATTRFSYELLARWSSPDHEPIEALEAVLVGDGRGLDYPGAQAGEVGGGTPRETGERSIAPASISRGYEVHATVEQVRDFYAEQVRAAGWTPVTSYPRGTFRSGSLDLAWKSDALYLGLDIQERRETDGVERPLRYSIRVVEIVPPDVQPGVPWIESPEPS